MKTTKVEIIKLDGFYYVRKTVTTTLGPFKISEDVSYLDDGKSAAFANNWWLSRSMYQAMFSSAEAAENAYKKYCFFKAPPPPPEIVKFLGNCDL